MAQRVHTAFVERASLNPDAIAVRAGSASVTYGQLLNRSRSVARQLAGRGLGPGDLVAVHLERDINLLPALLGVLQSGAAYLPLDVTDPVARVRTIVDDAAPSLVISSDPNLGHFTPPSVGLSQIGGTSSEPASPSADDLAYVIYTSGSTGAPKGVEVQHRSVTALFAAMDAHVNANDGDVWLSVTSPAFDISVFEYFWTLGKGMTVELADISGPRLFSTALARADHDITHMQATPTLLSGLMLDRATRFGLGQLRHLTCTGEALPVELARELRTTISGTLLNAYGPTETTIWSSVEQVGRVVPDPMSIGTPLEGQTIEILDDDLRPVTPGEAGELCIGGAGVAKGYRSRPELSAERFRSVQQGDVGAVQRLYRTGDLGYSLPDGRLVCTGRKDRQVKLRGHRIELDEVEHVLAGLDGVVAAAVVVVGVGTLARMVAFAVVDDTIADGASVRAAASEQLPAPGVPAEVKLMDELPTTVGGKLDRRRLHDQFVQSANSASAST